MESQSVNNNIDVSVIIVNYNSDELLDDCLSTLYKYTTGIRFEVIVIDNNSTIGNIDNVISAYAGIKLIKNDSNRGFGAANNQGLRAATGKYVLFLNNDTVFVENAIQNVYDFVQFQTLPVIVGCKLLNPDLTLQKSVYDFPSLLNVFTSNFFLYAIFPRSKHFNKYHLMNKQINEITEVDVVTGAFLLIERSTAMDLMGFDERFFLYNEETDLCKRFKKSGGKVYYYPLTSIIHLKGGTTNKNMRARYRNESLSTVQYFQKHFKGYRGPIAIFVHYLGRMIRTPIFFVIGLFTFNNRLLLRSYYNVLDLFTYPKNQFKN